MSEAPGVRIALWGANGRMGRAVAEVAAETPEASVVHGVDKGGEAPNPAEVDVVIDFSTPDSMEQALRWAVSNAVPFVSGTTGSSHAQLDEVRQAAESTAVLHAANFSLGVAVTRALVRKAAAALPLSFHPEIMEVHHRRKVDAPSGTALALAQDVDGTRGISACITGRSGQVGERTDYELGVFALRGGDVVGEHTVYFFGEGERVEIAHRATDRRIFARGAVAAAVWMAGRMPGVYTMEDVLGLAEG